MFSTHSRESYCLPTVLHFPAGATNQAVRQEPSPLISPFGKAHARPHPTIQVEGFESPGSDLRSPTTGVPRTPAPMEDSPLSSPAAHGNEVLNILLLLRCTHLSIPHQLQRPPAASHCPMCECRLISASPHSGRGALSPQGHQRDLHHGPQAACQKCHSLWWMSMSHSLPHPLEEGSL